MPVIPDPTAPESSAIELRQIADASEPKPQARLIDWCRLCGFEYSTPGLPPVHDCVPTNGAPVAPAPGHLTRDCIDGDVPGVDCDCPAVVD